MAGVVVVLACGQTPASRPPTLGEDPNRSMWDTDTCASDAECGLASAVDCCSCIGNALPVNLARHRERAKQREAQCAVKDVRCEPCAGPPSRPFRAAVCRRGFCSGEP